MQTMTLEEAKEKLGELIERPTQTNVLLVRRSDGSSVKISAELAPQPAPLVNGKRQLGFMKGQFTVPDDIKTPFEKEINEMFYGEE